MQFARGIDALQGMKPGPERDRLELDLQVGRGSACAVAYGHPAAETERPGDGLLRCCATTRTTRETTGRGAAFQRRCRRKVIWWLTQ